MWYNKISLKLIIQMQTLKEYLSFFFSYLKSRLLSFGLGFERFKSIIVALLVIKRGKYSTSFLNSSFFLLIATAFVAGPIIASNNPFIASLNKSGDAAEAAVVSYNPYSSSLSTVISAKPRDKIVDYTVASGDTIASIAQKFGVSEDTIKWANNLKTTTINPGTVLKVPPVTGVVHIVQSGENIRTIAKKYNSDAQKIVNFPFNDFADLETFALTTGQTLYVPDGSITIPSQRPGGLQQPTIAKIQAGARGSSNFIWPTSGNISQYPVWYHMALDIENGSHPAVIAADTGTVAYAGCINWGYGCHVIIDHGNGFQTLYGHMITGSILVQVGQNVGKGQQIGTMGSTGRSTGTHLHFEIISGGVQQNPLGYLK